MGFAIVEAAIEQGAIVTVVAGPVHLNTPAHSRRIDVETAGQMHAAVMSQIGEHDIFIGTAAVADYRPQVAQSQKIKKSGAELTLALVQNPDILKDVAALDAPPFTLGFAAETQNVKDNALLKLKNKKLQMIAANCVAVDANQTRQDTGFNSEYNALQVFWNDGEATLERCRKTQLARQLITLLAKRYHENTAT